MSRYVIGVDGGGTRTRAVLLDSEGTELGRAEGRTAVADAAAPDVAAGAVAEVCAAVAMSAGHTLPVDGLWAGVAGAGRESARSSVHLELSRMGVALEVGVGTDAYAAFHDAFADGPGILLISGTGSIAWGRSEDGREGRVGGWGQHIGDEGSGYAIGLEALRRVARHADGRAPETNLQRLILQRLGLETVDGLVQWASEATRAEVSDLARVVEVATDDGDAVAGEILVHAVEDLEGHVLTVLENLGPWSIPPSLAMGGGLLRPGGMLRKPLERVLARQHLAPMATTLDAARGAAMLALAMLD